MNLRFHPPEDDPAPFPAPEDHSAAGEDDSEADAPGAPEQRWPVCRLLRGQARRAERGHLWIFSNEIESFDMPPQDGGEVLVRTHKGRLLGAGLFSRAGLIAIRLYSRHARPFDAALVRERLQAALAWRRAHWSKADGESSLPVTAGRLADRSPEDDPELPPEPQACRLCFSEGDLLPGLIVDRYADHLVVQVLTSGIEQRREMIFDALEDMFHPSCIYERSDVPARRHEGLEERAGVVRGVLNENLCVTIDNLTLSADVAHGQKTGLFLDQVENWRAVRRLAKGRRVLDAFCYQGAWSLWAAKGGARECIGLDASQPAIDAARANALRNGMNDRCKFEAGDAFETLRRFGADGRQFDLIVLDPPPFAKNRKQVEDALRGYREINLRALRMLQPGGLLVTCSCSHHVSEEMLDDAIRLAARDAGRILRLRSIPGQPPDHPILLSTPETLYLKVRLLEVLE